MGVCIRVPTQNNATTTTAGIMTALLDIEKAKKEDGIYCLKMKHYHAQHVVHKDMIEVKQVQL